MYFNWSVSGCKSTQSPSWDFFVFLWPAPEKYIQNKTKQTTIANEKAQLQALPQV